MKQRKVCIVGASGKLGQYMIQHCLDRGYRVTGVCRSESVDKLKSYADRIDIIPGHTNDRAVIEKAVNNCDAVLTVLVPWGIDGYSTGTAQAVLDLSPHKARLIFSCGWHISMDGNDVYSRRFKLFVSVFGFLARLFRFADLNDQVEACNCIFNSPKQWTVVRCSDIAEGDSEGLPVWSDHVGDPVLKSNLTRRVDFALFMVEAIDNDELIRRAPAIAAAS